ncbi:MAG: DNA polymerase IV [Eubacteriales bacterium]|jgi:DNA polymerase-4
MLERTILHCDLNAFYASVEALKRPELKKVPMAVCGNPKNRHGIILAKNELAKKCGILTAETVFSARRKCPDLVLVPPNHDDYEKYSKLVNQIYLRYTDRVEPFGIDESWLDVTGSLSLFGSGKDIADSIREDVKSEIGLTVSVGVSFNKVFAKLGSDLKKPDATTVISRDKYRDIVWPLPVKSLIYVGKAASQTLARMGILTIGDLAAADKRLVAMKLGKHGEMICTYARGEDDSEVRVFEDDPDLKTVGNGMTFSRDLVDINDIKAGVTELADTVAMRLRKNGLMCTTVQVQIRDPHFKTISRQRALKNPTQYAREITEAAMQLIRNSWKVGAPIRSIAITGANLIPEDYATEQLDLFDTSIYMRRERTRKIASAIDSIRDKYGKESISFGSKLGKDIFASHETDAENDKTE